MRMLTIAAAAALLTAPATAQDGLTEDRVRSFIDQSTEEAQLLVETGDWAGIQSWYEQRLSDTAQIAARATMLVQDGPTMTFSITMDAKDLQGFSGMMGQAHGTQNPIEDFSLKADVRSVTELPDGGASAVVAFDESGVLVTPAVAGGSATPSGEMERVVFQTSSTCNVRLAPDGDSVMIEMIACESVSTVG
ncbi:MAG TPA: hypothetical protein VFJ13_01295 [Paracoccaceae bacterium]|nr:hypothetical protein [Paracoccaceae bacterium]